MRKQENRILVLLSYCPIIKNFYIDLTMDNLYIIFSFLLRTLTPNFCFCLRILPPDSSCFLPFIAVYAVFFNLFRHIFFFALFSGSIILFCPHWIIFTLVLCMCLMFCLHLVHGGSQLCKEMQNNAI